MKKEVGKKRRLYLMEGSQNGVVLFEEWLPEYSERQAIKYMKIGNPNYIIRVIKIAEMPKEEKKEEIMQNFNFI